MTGRLHVRNDKYCIIISYQDETGKTKQKWIQTDLPEKNNKRRAEKLMNEEVTKFEESLLIKEEQLSTMCMPKLVTEWLKVKKMTLRASSYNIYETTAVSRVIPYFEELQIPVQQLTPLDIQRYFTDHMDKGFKASTMPKHKTIIHGALGYAIETLGIIELNPADKIKMPKRQKRVPKFYTEDQLRKLFSIAKDCSIEAAIRISATYGLRRSEVLGLKWDAVDWKRKTIVIQHTVVRVGAEAVGDDVVKESASFRTMPLIPEMEEYFLRLQSHQSKMKKLCGRDYVKNDYICRWDNGEPFDPNYITRKFRQLLKEHELPHIRFHDLRHSSASLLINMGFTLKEVQEWLGHADITSTEIYAHLLYKSKEEMASKVGKALFGNSNEEPLERIG